VVIGDNFATIAAVLWIFLMILRRSMLIYTGYAIDLVVNSGRTLPLAFRCIAAGKTIVKFPHLYSQYL
jgi:hypothetical protein